MKDDYQAVYEMLHRIYETYRDNHPENPDSEQMCCMWSTYDLYVHQWIWVAGWAGKGAPSNPYGV